MPQLGEGGYSFVFLVEEIGASGPGARYALKKVLAGSAAQLQEAQWEIKVTDCASVIFVSSTVTTRL